MKSKPTVGQKLFSLNVGNAASRHRESRLTPVTVTHVGRKYFRANAGDRKWTEVEYHLENWAEHSNYSACSVLYETEQEYFDEVEIDQISKEIENAFRHGVNHKGLGVEKLRVIQGIILGVPF